MTPLLTGISVPGVNFSQPEPKNISFLTDFDSDLRENGAFWGKVCSLEVAIKLKDLQFTFSPLVVVPACANRDTEQ
jgi:hypothetical protein